jgi:hypothetical protein
MSCTTGVLEKSYKFLDRHFRLHDYRFGCLWRQITDMHWDDDMKVCLCVVAEIGVATCLMVQIETRSQQRLQHFL